MAGKKFIRRDHGRYSKLGNKRKKLQKWRAAKGRDNKIREKRKGYPKSPAIGYRSPSKERHLIDEKVPLRVQNVKDLEKADKNSVLILARVGGKKKIEIIKRAKEINAKILNLGGAKDAAK